VFIVTKANWTSNQNSIPSVFDSLLRSSNERPTYIVAISLIQ